MKKLRDSLSAREHSLGEKERVLQERERQLSTLVAQKDNEIVSLQHTIAQHQQYHAFTQHDVELAVKEAITKREEELRVLVMQREEEVATAMARREEEIIASVNQREEEFCRAWTNREQQWQQEVEQQVQLIRQRELEIAEEEGRLRAATVELEERIRTWAPSSSRGSPFLLCLGTTD
jgi:NIMA (never in mitosis gene a)-related kinase